MEQEKRSLRIGGYLIAFALLLRLFGGSAWDSAVQFFSRSDVTSAILLLETGRFHRPAQELQSTIPASSPTEVSQTQTPLLFSPEDEALVKVSNDSGYEADVETFLCTPLQWDLTQDAPTVLILHTHGSESYENTENYTESASYRTQDTNYNVVSIGARIAEILQKEGIGVIHDTRLHDIPSYSGAYYSAREAVQTYLAEYPSICMILDIHRDSATDSSGKQVVPTISLGQEESAKLMFVVGSDAAGYTHPDWENNMGLAVKLQAQLEKQHPGICRPINFRSQRFNQDLCPGSLLIEVGSAGNTRTQALVAAEKLANTVVAMAQGAENSA